MKKLFFVPLIYLLSTASIVKVDAAKSTSPDKQSVSLDTWYAQPKVVVRVLNKLDSTSTLLTIPVGGTVQYKTLTIGVKKCVVRPPSLSPDSAAFIEITDSKLPTTPFSAWIFSAEPGASVFQHPLYNVSMVGCAGKMSDKPLVAQPSTPSEQGQNSSNDLEQSLENSIQSQH